MWFVVWSKCSNLIYRNSESVPKFEIMLRLPDLYWMSEDVTFLSNVPSFLSGNRVRSDPFQIQFLISSKPVIVGGSRCGQADPILSLQEFRIPPKFEIILRLPDLNEMSEDVTFLSNVPSFLSWESSSKRPVSDRFFRSRWQL